LVPLFQKSNSGFLSSFRRQAIAETGQAGLGGSCLVGDLEYFNVFRFELFRTREKCPLVQSGVVGVTEANERVTLGVCFAVIGDTNVTKVWSLIEFRSRGSGLGLRTEVPKPDCSSTA
jgi:hypothetical protein